MHKPPPTERYRGNIYSLRETNMTPSSVRIVEVGPRDGLQNITTPIPTPIKLELILRLHQTGLKTIELTSIVSPRRIPQLADCRNLLEHPSIQSLGGDSPDLRLPVLVPNLKGLKVCQALNAKEIAVFVSATEGFSRANINCSVEVGLARAREVVGRAVQDGLAVRGYVESSSTSPPLGSTRLITVSDTCPASSAIPTTDPPRLMRCSAACKPSSKRDVTRSA